MNARKASLATACAVFFFLDGPTPTRGAEDAGAAPSSPAASESSSTPSPEERLLQAELLEAATGDFERAAALFRELVEDRSLDRSIRDEARLGLGRVERKRGELEAARNALGALVADDGAGEDVRRRARSYLVELDRGEPAERRFDWIAELQRNPEIQARIFSDIMALTDPEKAVTSARQLLALGPVAVPMLEQAVDQSRDPEQRRRIALVLVQLGRYEALGTAFAGGIPEVPSNVLYKNLLESVRSLRDEENVRLRDALRELEPGDAAAAERASALALAAGETRDLARQLARAERVFYQPNLPPGGLSVEVVFASLFATPEGREAIRARIADLASSRIWLQVFDKLADNLRPLLGPASILALLAKIDWPKPDRMVRNEDRDRARALVHLLVERKGLDEAVAYRSPDAVLPWLLWSFHDEHLGSRVSAEFAGVDSDWALVHRAAWDILRERPLSGREVTTTPAGTTRPESAEAVRTAEAKRAFTALRLLAEAHDAAIPVWLDVLREASDEPAVRDSLDFKHTKPDWRPSDAYARALAELLGSSSDPIVLGFALEALALAAPGTPDVLPRLREIAREHPDAHIREMALYAAIRRLESFPETASEVAALIADDYRARAGKPLDESYVTSPWAGASERGHVVASSYWVAPDGRSHVRPSWYSVGTGANIAPAWQLGARDSVVENLFDPTGAFTWAVRATGAGPLRTLHGPLFELATRDPELRSLYSWFYSRPGARPGVADAVAHPLSLKQRLDRVIESARTLGDEAKPLVAWIAGESGLFAFERAEAEQRGRRLRRAVPAGPRRTSVFFDPSLWESLVPQDARPELYPYLFDLLQDPGIPAETRSSIFRVLGKRALGELDWKTLFASDDPLALEVAETFFAFTKPIWGPYYGPEKPEEAEGGNEEGASIGVERFRAAILAALRSPFPELRREAVEHLRAALPEPKGRVRVLAPLAEAESDPRVAWDILDELLLTREPSAVTPIVDQFFLAERELLKADPSRDYLPRQIDKFDPGSRDRLLAALLASPNPGWRAAAAAGWSNFADPFAAFAAGLADEVPEVRGAWFGYLRRAEDARTIPLLIDLLDKEKWRDDRVKILALLAERADARSLEAIAPLLEDRDLQVRKAALAAVEAIRHAIEQRAEVKRLVDALRETRNGKPKAEESESSTDSGDPDREEP